MWKGDTTILAFCKILQAWRLQKRQSQKMEETSWQICYSFPNSAQQTEILFYCRIFYDIQLNLYTMYIQQRGSKLVGTPAWSSRCLVPIQSNADLTVLLTHQSLCLFRPSVPSILRLRSPPDVWSCRLLSPNERFICLVWSLRLSGQLAFF
jgi:hypothetical protein